MSHECDDCGETFETLTRLRLHDCSGATDSGGASNEPGDIDRLDELLDAAADGETTALHQALATYEQHLASAHEADNVDRYRTISRTYSEPLVTALDDATQREGWPFLADVVDAYHPTASDELPHVTTVLQNVTGRYLVRTRLADGIDAVPVAALEYFDVVLGEVGDHQDFIREALHPYGWGIGHPEHAVADRIHAQAAEDLFLANPLLEHAFYADQHAAIDVLERIVHDESIQETIPHPDGDISETRYLLDAPAGAASDFSPTIPRYWDWEDELEYSFELAEDVERRIRELAREEGLDAELPDDWAVADLTL